MDDNNITPENYDTVTTDAAEVSSTHATGYDQNTGAFNS